MVVAVYTGIPLRSGFLLITFHSDPIDFEIV